MLKIEVTLSHGKIEVAAKPDDDDESNKFIDLYK